MDIFLLHTFSHIEASLTRSVITFLENKVAALASVLLALLLRPDGQITVRQLCLDILLGKSRQIHVQDVIAILLLHISLHQRVAEISSS